MQDSIINVIQKMVQEGQPREKIIQTLRDLGVEEEQAKKLLMIAEADTFTLLKKEINFLVKDEFAGQKTDFEEIIHNDLEKVENEQKSLVKKIALDELSDVREDVIKETKGFEERVNNAINSSQKTVSMVKIALDSINERLAQMELDVEQMKVHKFRKKSMVISYAVLVAGALLLATSVYLLVFNFTLMDIPQMIMILIMALASIVLMFASVIG